MQVYLGIEVDLQVVFDGHGNFGVQITPAGRIGPDLAAGVNPAISWSPDADNIGDLTGLGVFVGVDLFAVSGAATFAINTSKTPNECTPGESDNLVQRGIQLSGFGPGGGLGATLGAGYTFMPLSGNPFRWLRDQF